MKNHIFNIVLVSMTIATSAFVSVPKSSPGDVYGNLSGSTYTRLNDPYDPSLCVNSNTLPCRYTETNAGAGHVTSPFGASQGAVWESLGYLIASSEKGVYAGSK